MWKTRNARSHSDHAMRNVRDHTRPMCMCVYVWGRKRWESGVGKQRWRSTMRERRKKKKKKMELARERTRARALCGESVGDFVLFNNTNGLRSPLCRMSRIHLFRYWMWMWERVVLYVHMTIVYMHRRHYFTIETIKVAKYGRGHGPARVHRENNDVEMRETAHKTRTKTREK